jgi:O-antigen ligase
VPPAGLALISLALFAFVAMARLKPATVVLLAVVVLIPPGLAPPFNIPFLSVPNMAMYGFLLGLGRRALKGEVPAEVFRPNVVAYCFLAFLAVLYVNGVALSDTGVPGTIDKFVLYAEHLLFFLAVLAAVRLIGDVRWVATVFVGVTFVSVGIALAEHFTRSSWAHWWYQGNPTQAGSVGGQALESVLRNRSPGGPGELRVRAAATFALEFGWVIALAFPLVVVITARSRRLVMRAAPPAAAVLAVGWSNSRSALAAVGVGVLLVMVLTRFDRRVVGTGLTLAAAALVIYVAVPSVRAPFDVANQSGSIDTRSDRLPRVGEVVADNPYVGIGLGGLATVGLQTLDSTYLFILAETGVIGLVVFCVLLLTTVCVVASGARVRDGPDHDLRGALAVSMLLAVPGSAALNLLGLPGAGRQFWLLVALGVAALDRATADRPAVERARSPWRAAAVVMAAFAALGVRALVPTHAVASYSIETIPITGLLTTRGAQGTHGAIMAATGCGLLEESAEGTGASVRCEDPRTTPGLARLRVETATAARTTAAVERANSHVERHLPSFSAQWPAPIDIGQPTWAYTAPVWVPLTAVAGAILVPGRRRRRGEAAQPVR